MFGLLCVFLFRISSRLDVLEGSQLISLTIRYDVRLILDPELSTNQGNRRLSSPSGWSDIPSDTEDTFFFSQVEAEDYRRDKRRRLMENAREERLRALAELESDQPQETCWASDEEVCIGFAWIYLQFTDLTPSWT